jgi:hypothetical protein
VLEAIEAVARRADVHVYPSGEGLTASGVGQLVRAPSVRRVALGAVDEPAVAALLEMGRLEQVSIRTDRLSDEAVRRLLSHEGVHVLTLVGPREPESGHTITDRAFDGLGAECRLTRLEVSRADIGVAALEELSGCESLRSLTLRHVPLSNHDWPHIVAIDTLRSLDVRETELTTIEPLVEGLPELQELALPNVSRFEVTALLGLRHLQEVDVTASQLTAPQVQRLLDEHPSLRLVRAEPHYVEDLRVPRHVRVEPNPYFTMHFERPRRLRWDGESRTPSP